MKIFSWMQNKLNGREKTNKIGSFPGAEEPVQETRKEVMDWPNGLLAIGTFGITNLKDPPNTPREDHLEDIPTDDQVKEFLSLQKGCSLPPENFSEILRALEDFCESNGENSSIKEVTKPRGDNHLGKKKSITKRALHFLLRQSFPGGGKPMLSPFLKDPLEVKLEKSRMEKILTAILHKKVHPQGSTPKTPARICLDTKSVAYNKYEEEAEVKTREECKWVKTDSEYIVLEI